VNARSPAIRRTAAVLAVLLGACGAESEPACLRRPRAETRAEDVRWVRSVTLEGDVRRVVARDGSEAVLPARPQRIVSTLPGITETVAALGALDRLVAVSEHCDRPPAVRDLPAVSVMPMSLEGIARHRPDLILVDGTLLRQALPDLRSRFGVVVALESRTLAHVSETFRLLGEVLGDDEARERAATLRGALDAAVRSAAPATAGERAPRVLLLGQSEPLYVLGPGALLDDMVRACGGVNVACDLHRASAPFAAELVRARRPDWILTTGGTLSDGLREQWASLPAVRDGRIADAGGDDVVRGGPRTAAALARLAAVLQGRAPPSALALPDEGGADGD
jgi:iron complex transport system substrate-binding protein